MSKKAPSAAVRDEIIRRMGAERRTITRVKKMIIDTKADLKAMTKELESALSRLVGLCGELESPEQICTTCGLVRDLDEPRWAVDTQCHDCRARKEAES